MRNGKKAVPRGGGHSYAGTLSPPPPPPEAVPRGGGDSYAGTLSILKGTLQRTSSADQSAKTSPHGRETHEDRSNGA